MGENDVPAGNDDDNESPARNLARQWLGVWQQSLDVQGARGCQGELEDWTAPWGFINLNAEVCSQPLIEATIAQLTQFVELLAAFEWAVIRLEQVVPECPPSVGGAILAIVERIRDGLGIAQPGPADVRDVFPALDEATEQRFAEYGAVINYWAGVASSRSRQIAALEERIETIETGTGTIVSSAESDPPVSASHAVLAMRAETGRLHGAAMATLARFRQSDRSL